MAKKKATTTSKPAKDLPANLPKAVGKNVPEGHEFRYGLIKAKRLKDKKPKQNKLD